MNIVVMIPAYNEEDSLAKVIGMIKQVRVGRERPHVLVIDDGSHDSTKMIAEKSADTTAVHSFNKGLGAAFKTGLETSLTLGADVIVNIDADGQFNPYDIPKLVGPIIEGKADMVSCTRFKDKALIPKMPLVKKVGNSFFTSLVNLSTGESFTDTQCGFRAYSRESAMRINSFGRLTYTQEVFLDLIYKGMKILEVPCKVKGQRKGKSRVVKNVFSYGLKALMIMLRTVRDHHPLAFFGSLGSVIFLAGFIPGTLLFVRWILTSLVSPYKSLVTLSALMIIIGFLLIVLAFIADILGRQKKVIEEMLYHEKRRRYSKRK